MKIFLLPIVLVACGAWLSTMVESPAPIEQQVAVAEIDFDALHSQAKAALEKLRQSNDRPMASTSATTF